MLQQVNLVRTGTTLEIIMVSHAFTDNLRFTVFPVAITYPTTVEQISTVVKVGASQKLNVVARSGGVYVFFFDTYYVLLSHYDLAFLHCKQSWGEKWITRGGFEQNDKHNY